MDYIARIMWFMVVFEIKKLKVLIVLLSEKTRGLIIGRT